MFELMISNIFSEAAGEPVAPGQMEWTAPGTYQFVIPAGVTKISIAVLGPGESWANRSSQRSCKGGALVWQNNVPVTPGTQISVTVGNHIVKNATSSCLGLVAGNYTTMTVPAGATGHAGGADFAATSSGTRAYGGSAATFTTNGAIGRSSTSPLLVPSATQYPPSGWNDQFASYDAGTFAAPRRGTGGSGDVAVSGGLTGNGGNGMVRIIWGDGRAFPNVNIGDV